MYKGYLIKTIDLKIIDNNSLSISIPPHNYENKYLWNSILEDILVRFTYSKKVRICFYNKQLFNIFVGFINEWFVDPIIENFDVYFYSCNKRVITELMYSYGFFEYSNAFSLIIEDQENKYCIYPLGDNLGIGIKYSDSYANFLFEIENVCKEYDVILERNGCKNG